MGSDHSSPTWQLHSLGSLLSSHLADEECLHLYKGDVDSTYFSGLPCTSNEPSHRQHLFTTALVRGKHTTCCFCWNIHSRYTTSTKSVGSEPWAPPKRPGLSQHLLALPHSLSLGTSVCSLERALHFGTSRGQTKWALINKNTPNLFKPLHNSTRKVLFLSSLFCS